MFEKATRLKLRFNCKPQGGLISVEDLWDLPLTSTHGAPNLNDIARNLNRQIRESETESFVTTASTVDEAVQLRFEIVKYIIKVRLGENEAAATLKMAKEKKQKLLTLIAKKEDETLEGTSLDELRAMAEAL